MAYPWTDYLFQSKGQSTRCNFCEYKYALVWFQVVSEKSVHFQLRITMFRLASAIRSVLSAHQSVPTIIAHFNVKRSPLFTFVSARARQGSLLINHSSPHEGTSSPKSTILAMVIGFRNKFKVEPCHYSNQKRISSCHHDPILKVARDIASVTFKFSTMI